MFARTPSPARPGGAGWTGRVPRLAGLALALLLVAAPPAWAIEYGVDFAPMADDDLAAAVRDSSRLLALAGEAEGPGAAGLIRRAEADRDRFLQALRSLGYYDGAVTVRVGDLPLDTPRLADRVAEMAEPVAVTVDVLPGDRYRVGALDIVDARAGGSDLSVAIDRAALGLAPGDPARSDHILRAEARLRDQMRRAGHPYAEVPVRQVIVDRAAGTVDIAFAIEPGPAATMGEVAFAGLEQVDPAFASGRVPFRPGDPYEPRLIEELRADLFATNVFSSVRTVTGEELTPDGRLPVLVEVEEGPRRFAGIAASYATSEGIVGEAYWGHRNLFGAAESIRFTVSAGGFLDNRPERADLGFRADFRKPDFLVRRQDLIAEAAIARAYQEAFDSDAVTLGAGLERRFSRTLSGSAMARFTGGAVTDADGRQALYIASLPVELRIDDTDNPLDPTEGYRLRATVTPSQVSGDRRQTVLSARLSGSAYLDLSDSGWSVLAVRGAVGGMYTGDDRLPPAPLRFFSGGGGSVRGFDFQSLGPRDARGRARGGRSLIEGGIELRQRVTETIGIVPFVEAGTVYDSAVPDFSEELRVAAGLGLRYYTSFGPLRLDVATPLTRRSGERGFSVYLSLGQSF